MIKKDAIFDKTRNHRYLLIRQWEKGTKFVNFILLNPSTADEKLDDPTIRACITFAKNWGFDGIYITNLFSYRTKSPKELKKANEPIGVKCDNYIKEFAIKSNLIVCAWGNHGTYLNRNKEIIKLLKKIDLYCLGITKKGEPKHPLYIKRTIELVKFV